MTSEASAPAAAVVRPDGVLAVSAASAAGGLALAGLALGHRNYPLLLAGLLLVGYGTATGVFAATVAATQGVANAEQGLAGGMINMSRQVGAAVGAAVSAAVIGSSAASPNPVTADRAALLVTAAAAALAAAIALRGIGARSTPPAAEANSADRAASPVADATVRSGKR